MRTRTLADRTIAAIGCGDISLARAAMRGIDATEVAATLHAAIAAGIDVLDTAADAEALVGDAVRSLRVRDRAIVATRVPTAVPRQLQRHVEDSLRATRLDALPLVLLPLADKDRERPEWPELAGTCARLVREGKVVRWGSDGDIVAPEGGPGLTGRDEIDWLVVAAIPFSLCERRELPAAPLVLARRPLAGGALAGTLGPRVPLHPRDDRRDISPAQLETIAAAMARLAPHVLHEPPAARSCDAARAILEANRRPDHVECATVAELALRWALDRGALVLPRLHRREHLAEALRAGSAAILSTSAQVFSMLVDGEIPADGEPA